MIIVTGSTTGIGKAIALRCISEGARVVITGLERDLGDAVIKDIPRRKSALHIGDITTEGAAAEIADVAVRAFGRIDAVVNNAAAVVASDIHTTDSTFLRKVLEVNTVAPLALIRSALPYLEKSGGCVLNIGSVNAYSGEPGLLAYSISKGALMTMTRNLGDTLNRTHGIRVNQINPGWVLTENEAERKRAQDLPDDWYTALPDVYAPSGRILKPEEIAAAAVYWLSDECGPVSGQVVELEQYPVIGRNPTKDGKW